MRGYREALRDFRAQYAFELALEHDGNILEEERATGIHRNSISRWLAGGGHTVACIRELVRQGGGQPVKRLRQSEPLGDVHTRSVA